MPLFKRALLFFLVAAFFLVAVQAELFLNIARCHDCSSLRKRVDGPIRYAAWCAIGTSNVSVLSEEITPAFFSFVDMPRFYACVDTAVRPGISFPHGCTGYAVIDEYVSGTSKNRTILI